MANMAQKNQLFLSFTTCVHLNASILDITDINEIKVAYKIKQISSTSSLDDT